jgi:hypothetical protein
MGKHDEVRQRKNGERPARDLEPVRIEEKQTAVWTIVARAGVAALAAFAGALATASIGDGGILVGQYWAAVAAGTVALGGVIGVPDKHLDTFAPRGEVQNMRTDQERET